MLVPEIKSMGFNRLQVDLAEVDALADADLAALGESLADQRAVAAALPVGDAALEHLEVVERL